MRIAYAVIYDGAFVEKWWHHLVPPRWRPTGLLAHFDLSRDD